MHVSVVVIARDVEKSLPVCLAGIKGLTDNIVVVVDTRTSDNTKVLAQNLGCQVFERKFDSYSGQKNYADSKAKYDWILSLDADETASPGLVAAIKTLPENPLFKSYNLPRKNKIFGKYITHTNWDPNGLIRLFDKNYCRWEGKIHEEIVTKGDTGRLYDCIYHDNYQDVEEFMTRQDRYSTIRAEELYNHKTRFSLFRFFVEPLTDFVRRYFWHVGFLDSLHGLFLSYLMSIYHLSVWIKLWQKYQKVSS
jgi:glycosyltransferase involved in cell wall biosynthesis